MKAAQKQKVEESSQKILNLLRRQIARRVRKVMKKKEVFKSFTLRPYKQKRRISITKKFEKLKDNFTKKSISESVDETSEYLDSMDQKLDK